MKYIKKYENFRKINEITTTISTEQFNTIFNVCCKGVDLENDTPIMRSLNGELRDDYYLIDPRKHERVSANTVNYYTMIIDNTDAWKDFPKRKHGIISSLNSSYMGDEYRVVPLLNYDNMLKEFNVDNFVDTKWGVCPTWDLWNSFESLFLEIGFKHITSAEDINTLLNAIYYEKSNQNLENNNFDYFKLGLQSVKNIIQPEGYIYEDWSEDINTLRSFMEKNDMNLYDFATYVFNPDRNDFRVETYDKIKTHTKNTNQIFCNEVWTDTPVLYIKK